MTSPLVFLRIYATLVISLVGASGYAMQAIATMKERPGMLKLSLSALECMDLKGQRRKVLVSPGSPTLSHVFTMSSNLSVVIIANDASAVSQYTPSEFERKAYYNGITADDKHPQLVYRSDCLTIPFLKPSGRYPHLAVKSIRGVFKPRSVMSGTLSVPRSVS